jgi:hypothetical protein
VDVGEPIRTYTVAPLEDPLPREVEVPEPSDEPEEAPAVPEPAAPA